MKKSGWFVAGVILSLIAFVLLLVNAVLGLIYSNIITGAAVNENIRIALKSLSLLWLVLGFLLVLALIKIYQGLRNWFYFLIIAFLALFSFRLESFVLLLLSSIFFLKEKRKNRV
ncbi:MAG: hypothetical protein QXS07_00895 [Candidatus Pacearchaeota archaeon]